jgi:hypothetical protein
MKKLLILLLLLPTLTLAAESTLNCHCFQNRTYDHKDRAAADPYFLASSQSSFVSAIYDVEKRALVMAKMSGANNDYLWILYDLAKRTGQSSKQVAAIHKQENNWTKTFEKLGQSPQSLGKDYWASGSEPRQLANLIVDDHLIRFFSVSKTDIQNWRDKGLNRKEIILGNILDGKPVDLYNQVNSQMKSWGQLLDEQGLKTGKEVTRKLKAQMTGSAS